MAGSHHFGDVRITFRSGPTRLGMLGDGIMYASILHYQSNILSDTQLSLRKGCRRMGNLPLVSAIAFIAGTWIFFDIHELWFIVYAIVYLIIRWIAMFISKHLNRHVQKS